MTTTTKFPKTKMRAVLKFYSALVLLLFIVNTSKAAVGSYSFAYSAGTYTPIAGTTLFSGAWDDSNSGSLTIPFTFTYNGSSFTTLGVSSNGFIRLGGLTSTVYCGLQTSDPNTIAGYGTDLVGNTGSVVSYATVGSAPNRQFVIQWTDCKHYSATGDSYSFQIILNENGNTVQVVWGPVTAATTMGANTCQDIATESGNVGLKGSSNADYNLRSVTNGTNTWATSVSGAALSSVCNMSPSNFPASGLTYTWTPPVPTPMVFTSCTTAFLNNGEVDGKGSPHQIIQVQVVTTGNLSPFDVTSITLSTAGCTNPSVDIASAKVHYTGLSGTFSSSNQFGSLVANPNGTYTMNGTVTLQEGTNYFWITYDVATNATLGNILTGCCTQVVGTGSMGTHVPTVTCPAGTHTVGPPLGYWTPVSQSAPSSSGGVMLVLSDGTVMAKSSSGGGSYGNLWNRLTPDASGSYVNGTWTTLAPMINTRLYFSSQILKDGRVYVAGGEYGTGLSQAEVYNPLTNAWTAAPSPGVSISDANSEILEDGRVLQALVAGNLKTTQIYNPATNTYSPGPQCLGIHNESAWVKLPDNSILFVDRLSTSSERYIPSLNSWVADGTVPVALYDPFGDETGGALLLPDGRAFFIGSMGHTAYYTPSGTSSPGVWVAGPDIPGGQGVPDGAAAMMADGRILLAVSPIPTSGNHFPPPTAFYEFDYLSNTFTLINTPFGGTSTSMSCYITNMTALPNGSILYSTQGSSQYYTYTPGSPQLPAGQPVIAAIQQTNCNTFSITGTQFNGISQGGTYGDDWQMATNYPIIRLTNGSNVYYCRTFNWNSTGVQRGLQADTVQFTLPAGLPIATYSLVVTANGIASNPVSFTPVPYLTSTLTPTAICSNSAFSYASAALPATATKTWTRAAVAGISNAAVTIPQTSDPNEVLINTTSNPVSVVYSFTITSNGCSNTQQVTVVVNPTPNTGISGSLAFCAGSSTTLSVGAGFSSYLWSNGATTQSVSVNTAGNFTATVTNSFGCSYTTAPVTTFSNPLPVATISGALSFCPGNSTTLDLGPGFLAYQWSTGATTQTITVNTAGTFTATVTNSNFCSASTSVTTTIGANLNPVITGNLTFCAGSSTTLDLGAGYSSYLWSTGATTQTINVSTGGNYSGTVTLSGCSGTSSTVTTVVNPSPTPTITGTLSICSGGSTILNAGPGFNSYQWSTGATSQTTTINTAGTITVTVTNANGCTGATSATTTISSNPVPVITGTLAFCTGGSTTLDAGSGFSSYNWSTGATTQTILVSNAGTFTATVTNANGCSGSASVTTTVNQNVNPVISGSLSFCSGSSTTLDLGSGYSSYSWSNGATTQTINVSTAGTYSGTVTLNGCTGTSPSVTTSVIAGPVATLSGGGAICIGSVSPLTIDFTGTGPWTYSLNGGSQATTSNNPEIINVNPTSTTTYSITSLSTSTCTGTSSGSVTVSVSAAPPSGSMSIPANSYPVSACAGNSIVVTCNPVPGATTYTWSTNAGTLINGQSGSVSTNTPNATITFGPLAPNASNWEICVFASNACGVTNTKCFSIRGNLSTPSSITGSVVSCPSTSGLYSTTAVAGANGYLWTGTNGITFTGSGTSVNANFPAGFTSGTICVSATLTCGYVGSSRCIAVANTTPTLGQMTGPFALCPGSVNQVFSVPPAAGAASYTWSVPANVSIVSGQGTPSLTVNVGAGFNNGQICVYATSSCGAQTALRCKTMSTTAPATPGNIIGQATSVCDQSTTYSVAAIQGVTSYTWSISGAGASLTSANGSNNINVTFAPGFSNATLCVVANNACGTSQSRCINLKGTPADPAPISGPVSVCAFDAGVNFSVPPTLGATGYVWTVPSGAAIMFGVNTNSIFVDWGSVGGLVTVRAINACGSSGTRTFNVGIGCKISSGDISNNTISVYPNPVRELLNVDMDAKVSGAYKFMIRDVSGRLIYEKSQSIIEGSNHLQFDMKSYNSGFYLFEIIDPNSFTKQIRIAVE